MSRWCSRAWLGLVIEDVTDEGELIRVLARSRRVPVPCPECAVETAHVHGWCERTVADVPVDGRPVVLDVRVRRLACRDWRCPRRTFREQLPGLLERYQRRTVRLTDVLGMWVGTGGEGAKHWMTVLAELRNRGVQDVCIACCDGLKGLPEAIEEIWPQVTVQQCVVHLVRSSLRYASKAHWSRLTRDLRQIYTAPTEAAQQRFAEFEAEWGDRYPAVIRLWRDAWPTFTPFLAFLAEIRKVVYTTNAIESLNVRFRQATRRRGHFPSSRSLQRCSTWSSASR